MATGIFIKLWVESYSSPALSGRTTLLPIIKCFNTNDKVGNISLLCRITWNQPIDIIIYYIQPTTHFGVKSICCMRSSITP